MEDDGYKRRKLIVMALFFGAFVLFLLWIWSFFDEPAVRLPIQVWLR